MIPRWLLIGGAAFLLSFPLGLAVAWALRHPRIGCWVWRQIDGEHDWRQLDSDRLDNGDVRSVIECRICGQLAVETCETRPQGEEAELVHVEIEELPEREGSR